MRECRRWSLSSGAFGRGRRQEPSDHCGVILVAQSCGQRAKILAKDASLAHPPTDCCGEATSSWLRAEGNGAGNAQLTEDYPGVAIRVERRPEDVSHRIGGPRDCAEWHEHVTRDPQKLDLVALDEVRFEGEIAFELLPSDLVDQLGDTPIARCLFLLEELHVLLGIFELHANFGQSNSAVRRGLRRRLACQKALKSLWPTTGLFD